MRAEKNDFLQQHRFWVSVGDPTSSRLTATRRPDVAGFSQMSSPKLTTGKTYYREGQMVYPRLLPGLPTFNTVTLTRGVAQGDGSFFDWAKECAEGGEAREDVTVFQFHRTALGTPESRALSQALRRNDNVTVIDVLRSQPARLLKLKNALPTGYEPGGFDASSGQVSLMSLDIDYTPFDEEHRRAA
jgi:phage tail-like protein